MNRISFSYLEVQIYILSNPRFTSSLSVIGLKEYVVCSHSKVFALDTNCDLHLKIFLVSKIS